MVSWSTKLASSSQVEYGTSTSYGSSTAVDSTLVTSHSQGLSGLTPATLFHLRVHSRDASNTEVVSGDMTFTTSTAPDTTPPVISGVSASGITASGAMITWTTNEAADSQVEYGTSSSYGQSSALNSTRVTSHSVSLSGLSGSTTYHYRVKSRDAAGNLATSGDFTFTTSAAPPPDTTPPTVSVTAPAAGATVSGMISLTATASDNVGVVGVQFKVDGANVGPEVAASPYSVSLNTTTLSNAQHSVTATARDAAGNTATSVAVSFTVSNSAPPIPPGPAIVANQWVTVNPASDPNAIPDKGNCGGAPCPRSWFPMTYDSDARKTLVLGGGVGGGCLPTGGYVNDVWAYDYNTNSWKQRLGVDPNRSWPPGSDNVSAAYDPIQKRTWLHAGTCSLGFGYYDYATNSGTSKSGLPGQHGASVGVMDPDFAFDSDHNKVIAFSGEPNWYVDPGQRTDVFDPVANSWQNMNPSPYPPPRMQSEYGAVYATNVRKMIIFGGQDYGGNPDFDDTWEYDYPSNTWTRPPEANDLNPHPPRTSRHVSAWDSVHNVMLVIPAGSADTWVYDPIPHRWTKLLGTNAPTTNYLMGISFDSQNGVFIIFSGADTVTGNNRGGMWAFRYQPVGGYTVATLADEKAAYTRWGWTWTPSQEPNVPAQPTYAVNDPDIHGDTEGDDLWSYLEAYIRTGQPGYLDRAKAWASYFKTGYINCVGTANQTFCYDRNSFLLDHAYGYGLVAWYEYTGDATFLAAAETIAGYVETYYSDPKWDQGANIAYYNLRGGGRHLITVSRLAEVTRKARWITLRDKLVNIWLSSSGWDATKGMYFAGDFQTDYVQGAGSYASGLRIQSAFQIGVLAEAFWQTYRVTGDKRLSDRLVAMAHFVDGYGLDPTYQYTGSWFGHMNGVVWHNYSSGGTATFWDPNYTTSLVNTLMMGCKLSGDKTLCTRAKYFLNRGTKGVYGSPTQRMASDTQVGHFVDSEFASSSGYFYLDHNKGELLYTYLVFEAIF